MYLTTIRMPRENNVSYFIRVSKKNNIRMSEINNVSLISSRSERKSVPK